MGFEVGSIVTGKVTGITKFGAFVQLAPGKSGLVHISEIAATYVSDVHDFLTEGQEVKVKIIGIDDAGRINLSIKQTLPPPEKPAAPKFERSAAPQRTAQPRREPQPQPERSRGDVMDTIFGADTSAPADPSFEDKLKRFMQDSDSKMSGLKQYSDKRPRRRGR